MKANPLSRVFYSGSLMKTLRPPKTSQPLDPFLQTHLNNLGILLPYRGCRSGRAVKEKLTKLELNIHIRVHCCSPTRTNHPSTATRHTYKSDMEDQTGVFCNTPSGIAGNQIFHSPNRHRGINFSNLIKIQCENLTSKPTSRELPHILLSNTRSLVNKLDDLDVVIKSNGVSLACITETWLSNKIDDAVVEINGFSIVRRDRTSRTGGGVCAYIKRNIPFRVLEDLNNENYESLWLLLRPNRLPRGISCIISGIIYHPPSNDDNTFIEHLTLSLDKALNNYPNAGILLAGDFNRCPISGLCRRFNLKQIVDQPTRGTAILDLILTNIPYYSDPPQIIPAIGLSDHETILATPSSKNIVNTTTKVNLRKSNKTSQNALGIWLSGYDWNPLFYATTCEKKLTSFQNILRTGLDYFLPIKTIKIHDQDKPWMTLDFKAIINNRQKALQRGNTPKYNQLRNLANRECKKLKSNFLKRKLDQLKTNPNPKKWWDTVKLLAGYQSKKRITSLIVDKDILQGKVLGDKINNAFISVSQHITPLPSTPDPDFDSPNQPGIIHEFIISQEDVYEKLSAISALKSSGPDGIPNWVLKSYALQLSAPVTSIINSSIQQSYVPNTWRKAEVIPIPKTSSIVDINKDLRPISLTSTLSKICEKFVSNWVVKAIREKIDPRQFGCLPQTSTTHALLSMLHNWLEQTDGTNKMVRVFLLDFSKAFDLIDHNILLQKLSNLNVPPILVNWIKKFLTVRKQRVRIDQSVSEWRTINGGVPQGTVLGPILFLIMINDLASDWHDRWKFVDDSTISETIAKKSISKLQETIDDVSNWTSRNNMKLNISKCKELVIDFSKVKTNFPPLTIDGNIITRVQSTRMLGLTIQNNLRWNEHIDNIVKKASKRLYMLRVLKRANAEIKVLISVFITIIRPVLEYACQVWNYNIPLYLSDEIERVQKRAMRIILPAASSYTEFLKEANLTTLKERRDKLCSTFFKKIASTTNSSLSENIPRKVTEVSHYNLRNKNHYTQFRCKTERFRKSFFPQSILNLNS